MRDLSAIRATRYSDRNRYIYSGERDPKKLLYRSWAFDGVEYPEDSDEDEAAVVVTYLKFKVRMFSSLRFHSPSRLPALCARR